MPLQQRLMGCNLGGYARPGKAVTGPSRRPLYGPLDNLDSDLRWHAITDFLGEDYQLLGKCGNFKQKDGIGCSLQPQIGFLINSIRQIFRELVSKFVTKGLN